MRQWQTAISSMKEQATSSAGWKRWTRSVRFSSKASRLSPSRRTCPASRLWRKAFWDERCFPSAVTGPWERAPVAREDSGFRCEDMIPDSRIERGVARGWDKVFSFSYLNDERFGDGLNCPYFRKVLRSP